MLSQKPGQGPAKGIEICALIRLGVAVLFRCCGGPGTHVASIRVFAILKLAGDAKIDQSHAAAGQENDVLRFDIPVDHGRLLAVQDLQQGAQLLPQ